MNEEQAYNNAKGLLPSICHLVFRSLDCLAVDFICPSGEIPNRGDGNLHIHVPRIVICLSYKRTIYVNLAFDQILLLTNIQGLQCSKFIPVLLYEVRKLGQESPT